MARVAHTAVVRTAAEVEAEIARLGDLGNAALRERWQGLTGSLPASGLKGELLRVTLAYAIQEKAFGALGRDATRRLAAMARSGAANVGQHGSNAAGELTASARVPRRIKTGSRLIREWRRVIHEVVVVPDGFLWAGTVHASLSTVAKQITGTSWNGWRFFGLSELRAGREAKDQARAAVQTTMPPQPPGPPRSRRPIRTQIEARSKGWDSRNREGVTHDQS
jgi:hypothetical protein